MKHFKFFFKLERNRFLTAINVILAALFFIAAMYFIRAGSQWYYSILKDKNDFINIEQRKVGIHQNYSRYAGHGFRVQLMPSPLSIFFSNSGMFPGLTAGLDVGERLHLSGSRSGRDFFARSPGIQWDFASLFIVFATLIYLFYGYETFQHKDYLKMLRGLTGDKKTFLYFISARFLILTFFFLTVILCGTALTLCGGIIFTAGEYLSLLGLSGMWVLVSFIFFILGALIGTKKSKVPGFLSVILTWVCLVFVFPAAVNKIVSVKSGDIPLNYHLELEKFGYVMEFENRAIREVGQYSKKKAATDGGKALVESYISGEYSEICKLEKRVEQQLESQVNFFHSVCLFLPSTFFSSACSELSSLGYESGISFYKNAQSLKDGFVRFYIDKEYYPGDPRVEPFLRGEEYVYYGEVNFPGTTLWGVLLHIIWRIALPGIV